MARPWTPDDDETLRRKWLDGVSALDIGRDMGRSESAVWARVGKTLHLGPRVLTVARTVVRAKGADPEFLARIATEANAETLRVYGPKPDPLPRRPAPTRGPLDAFDPVSIDALADAQKYWTGRWPDLSSLTRENSL